jgi:hypothetical protein
MNKFALAIALSILPNYSNALTVQEGCKVLTDHIQVFAFAKEYGMPYESAVAWVADLTYVEPWSDLLATAIVELYSTDYEVPIQQMGTIAYTACLETFGVE